MGGIRKIQFAGLKCDIDQIVKKSSHTHTHTHIAELLVPFCLI